MHYIYTFFCKRHIWKGRLLRLQNQVFTNKEMLANNFYTKSIMILDS